MRIFSGVQPTGNIHIGNYLGALRQFVELQDEAVPGGRAEPFYCVVDLHAITVPKDPAQLRENNLDVAALYLAVGIDPKKSTVFIQSDVPGHAELAWVLMCNTYTGELSRMTQFKEKSRGNESAPAGLFTYPVLMASDILLYDSDVVPVGHDQKQHIELCRDVAIRVNNRFGDVFVVPEGRFLKEGARVMSLDNPLAKMSKSAENQLSRISLLDDEAKIRKAIMKSTTDSEGSIRYDLENKPGVTNLINIYSALSGLSVEAVERKYEGVGYGAFKNDLAEVAIDALTPIKKRFDEIRPSEELKAVLRDGAERANEIAARTMARVKGYFGLGK
ncbi:MAG: tryptophan--tRNA ligase [Clostridiales Family XIII bacterium]|jgi:tryptophanyl-tRNA synthetase|nr:tryptophan--tRNA ligase [Clostridiales Family XIII bacterium]